MQHAALIHMHCPTNGAAVRSVAAGDYRNVRQAPHAARDARVLAGEGQYLPPTVGDRSSAPPLLFTTPGERLHESQAAHNSTVGVLELSRVPKLRDAIVSRGVRRSNTRDAGKRKAFDVPEGDGYLNALQHMQDHLDAPGTAKTVADVPQVDLQSFMPEPMQREAVTPALQGMPVHVPPVVRPYSLGLFALRPSLAPAYEHIAVQAGLLAPRQGAPGPPVGEDGVPTAYAHPYAYLGKTLWDAWTQYVGHTLGAEFLRPAESAPRQALYWFQMWLERAFYEPARQAAASQSQWLRANTGPQHLRVNPVTAKYAARVRLDSTDGAPLRLTQEEASRPRVWTQIPGSGAAMIDEGDLATVEDLPALPLVDVQNKARMRLPMLWEEWGMTQPPSAGWDGVA